MKDFKKYSNVIKSVNLFKGIEADGLEALLKCLGSETKEAAANEPVLFAGDKPLHVGIVLGGRFHIIREDYDGNRSLIASVGAGDIFGEALCCAGIESSPVTVVADTDSAILLVSFNRIIKTCPESCLYHTRLIRNMLEIIAEKNLMLQKRMEIISLKSIRARVLLYLKSFKTERGKSITLPFNREETANYLCVERSALSHELARMKKDGLIEYKKNKFILK